MEGKCEIQMETYLRSVQLISPLQRHSCRPSPSTEWTSAILHMPSGSLFVMIWAQVGPLLTTHPHPLPSIDLPTDPHFKITADVSNLPSAPLKAPALDLLDAEMTAVCLISSVAASFSHQWELTMIDAWILQTVWLGLTLEFSSTPQTFHSMSHVIQPREAAPDVCGNPTSSAHPHYRASSHQTSWTGFYSIFFLVPKSSGGWRGILDLKELNKHITYHKFKM